MSDKVSTWLTGGGQIVRPSRKAQRSREVSNRREVAHRHAPRRDSVNEEVSREHAYREMRHKHVTKVALREYEEQVGFGNFSITAVENTIQTISELPNIAKKKNLYSITMPAGSGKTTLALEYGMLDIDSCVSMRGRAYLARAIQVVHDSKKYSVRDESLKWIGEVRCTFKCMEFSEPTVVLVHDDLTGYLIGAPKIGHADLPLDEKLSGDKERDALVRINDTISQMSDDYKMFDTRKELVSHVLSLAKKVGVDVSRRDVSGKTSEEIVAMAEAGRITKAQADLELMKAADRGGYGYTVNNWAMAFADWVRSEDDLACEPIMGLDDFKREFDWMARREVASIVTATWINDDDKVARLLWWENMGMDTSCSEVMLRILQFVPSRRIRSTMRWISDIVVNSRYVVDVKVSAKDRRAIMALAHLYGVRGASIKTFDNEYDEVEDVTSRAVRANLNPKNRSYHLRKEVCSVIESVYGKDLKSGSVKDLARACDGWSGMQVVSMLSACSSEAILDKRQNALLMACQVSDKCYEVGRRLDREMSKSMRMLLSREVNKCYGLIGLVAWKGLNYVMEKCNVEVEDEFGIMERLLTGKEKMGGDLGRILWKYSGNSDWVTGGPAE